MIEDHSMNNQFVSITDKTIIIDNKQLYFYIKILIDNDIEVLIPPMTKYMNNDSNVDEVLYIPDTTDKFTGLRFIFINTINLRTISNPALNKEETVVINLIIKIEEFSYDKISNSIIIRETFRDLSPVPNEVLFKGNSNLVKQTIEDHINSVIEYICGEYKRSINDFRI